MNQTNFTNDDYYNREKKYIPALIPQGNFSILDLGCGAGMLGRQLKSLGKASHIVGVELFESAAQEARKYYETVHTGDIEQLELPYESCFDYVICGDVLEHLRDPWKIVSCINGWLKPSGFLIASVPNIRYWGILFALAIRGVWRYTDSGILDRTHLRFFTCRTFRDALLSGGFEINSLTVIIHGSRKKMFNKYTGHLFKEFLGSQLLCSAHKKDCR